MMSPASTQESGNAAKPGKASLSPSSRRLQQSLGDGTAVTASGLEAQMRAEAESSSAAIKASKKEANKSSKKNEAKDKKVPSSKAANPSQNSSSQQVVSQQPVAAQPQVQNSNNHQMHQQAQQQQRQQDGLPPAPGFPPLTDPVQFYGQQQVGQDPTSLMAAAGQHQMYPGYAAQGNFQADPNQMYQNPHSFTYMQQQQQQQRQQPQQGGQPGSSSSATGGLDSASNPSANVAAGGFYDPSGVQQQTGAQQVPPGLVDNSTGVLSGATTTSNKRADNLMQQQPNDRGVSDAGLNTQNPNRNNNGQQQGRGGQVQQQKGGYGNISAASPPPQQATGYQNYGGPPGMATSMPYQVGTAGYAFQPSYGFSAAAAYGNQFYNQHTTAYGQPQPPSRGYQQASHSTQQRQGFNSHVDPYQQQHSQHNVYSGYEHSYASNNSTAAANNNKNAANALNHSSQNNPNQQQQDATNAAGVANPNQQQQNFGTNSLAGYGVQTGATGLNAAGSLNAGAVSSDLTGNAVTKHGQQDNNNNTAQGPPGYSYGYGQPQQHSQNNWMMQQTSMGFNQQNQSHQQQPYQNQNSQSWRN